MIIKIFAIFGFALILSLISTEVFGKPVTEGLSGCFGEICPDNTFACEKYTRISDDKAKLVIEIHCLGTRDVVLKNITQTTNNPFGPNTYFQGYSYSGRMIVTDTGTNCTEGTTTERETEPLASDDKETEFNEVEEFK